MDKITADNTKEFSCDAGIVWEKKDASLKMLPQASVDLEPSVYGYNSLKVGKTYSIKVKIYLRDAALDSKPIETTIKVKVSEKPGLIIG
jgi:hypothetical protein